MKILRTRSSLLLVALTMALATACSGPEGGSTWESDPDLGKADDPAASLLSGTWRTSDSIPDTGEIVVLALKADGTYLSEIADCETCPNQEDSGNWSVDTSSYPVAVIFLAGNVDTYLRYQYRGSNTDHLEILQVDETYAPVSPVRAFGLSRATVGYCSTTSDCEKQPLYRPSEEGSWACVDKACGFEETSCIEKPDTEESTAMNTGGAPVGRTWHSAVWTGSELIVWGGQDSSGSYLQDGGRYDPSNDSWSPMSTAGAPSARMRHLAVWTGTEMAIFGGYGDGTNPNEGALYNPSTDTWTPIPALPNWCQACSKEYNKAIWTGSEILFWQNSLEGGVVFDPASGTWGSVVSPPVLFSESGSLRSRGEVLAWSGTEIIAHFSQHHDRFSTRKQTASLNLATGEWTTLNSEGAPWGYTRGVAANGDLLVFESSSGGNGGIYRRDADYWADTATGPSEDRMMAWAGRQVLLCRKIYDASTGGAADPQGTLCNRYNPATRIWAPDTQVSDISFGSEATYTWADDRLLIWGGRTRHLVAGFEIDTLASNQGVAYQPPSCE